MPTPTVPTMIVLSILHDGRVLIELLADHYKSFAAAQVHVAGPDGTAALLLEWAAQARNRALPTPRGRSAVRAEIPVEFSDGYVVYISAQAGAGLGRFSDAPGALASRFRDTFQDPEIAGESRVAQSFAQQLGQDIGRFYRAAQRRSLDRLAGGEYLRILAHYLAQLRSKVSADDQNFYQAWRNSTGKIIDDEAYLLLCEDSGARSLYLAIRAEEGQLYQWYMNLAKGGCSGPR